MAILKNQNKITDFLMISAWLCRFKLCTVAFLSFKINESSDLSNLL